MVSNLLLVLRLALRDLNPLKKEFGPIVQPYKEWINVHKLTTLRSGGVGGVGCCRSP